MRFAACIASATLLVLAGCAAQQATRPGGPAGATAPGLRVRDLDSPADPGAGEPHLTATPDGAILMSWIEPGRDGHRALRLALLSGTRWSPVLTIAKGDSLSANWANFPAACAFGAHGLAVAWPWKSGEGDEDTQLRISLSADGGEKWTRPAVLHDDRAGSQHGFVSLVPQGNGVRAVWLDGHNLKSGVEEGMADMTLHTRFLSATGSLGREQEIDERVCDCCQTAMIAAGSDVLVAYRDRSAEEIRDISVVRLDDGKWTTPVSPRTDGFKITGCPVNGPALATKGARVAIAWFTNAEDQPRVFVAFSTDGGRTFGAPTRVDDGRPMGRCGVALTSDGAAVVTWIEAGKDGSQVRARLVRAGERPGASLAIARLSGVRASQVPQIATADGRALVVAWTDPGTTPRVRMATLETK